MWIEGKHCKKIVKPPTNDLLEAVKGNLESTEAQIWFAKFCQANPYFAVKLLIGVKLAPVQDIILRALIKRDFSLLIAGRGFSKSFTISIFIILYAIFYPGSKIGICSGTFRQSKNIFKQLEAFINGENGCFLRQCVTKQPARTTDAWEMGIGGSSIIATPMGGGDRLRGYRFNVMIMDELLLVPGEIVNNVIRPFLSVKQHGQEEFEVRKYEDLLIEAGKLKEEDRIQFPSNKLIGLSSAGYKFDSLYKENYEPYVRAIMDPDAEEVNHCVFRLSYRVAPEWLLDKKLINEGKRTMSSQQFAREFDAIFTDDSGGYFSVQKMEEATVPNGQRPTVLIRGDSKKKYVLGIDPNSNDAENSDHFAMALLELNENNSSGTLVHAYAMAKSNIKKRGEYLRYLLNNFNIVYVIVDSGGGEQFIRETRDLNLLPKPIELFDADFYNPNNYEVGLTNARRTYNESQGKILHVQHFGESGWIRLANEMMQGNIEHKRLMFASKVTAHDIYENVMSQSIPILELEYSLLTEKEIDARGKQADFIDNLEFLIDLTKKETGLIEGETFNLPKNLMTDRKNPNRARRDSYTALLLANYGMNCYYEMMKKPNRAERTIFMPTFVA